MINTLPKTNIAGWKQRHFVLTVFTKKNGDFAMAMLVYQRVIFHDEFVSSNVVESDRAMTVMQTTGWRPWMSPEQNRW